MPSNFRFPMLEFDDDDDRYVIDLHHVKTPAEIWITLRMHGDNYNRLFEHLNYVYARLLREKKIRPLKRVEVGDHIVRHINPNWVRGQVFAERKPRREGDPPRYDILDLDSGELRERVDFCELYPVIEEDRVIRQTPTFAVRCKLNVEPPGCREWSPESVEKFEKNYGDSVTLKAQFIGRDGDCYRASITMGKNERDITDHMIASGLGRRPKLHQNDITLPYFDLGFGVGGNARVIVAVVESPSLFWIQLERDEDFISKLAHEINAEYNHNEKKYDKYSKLTPHKGTYCVARYEADDRWYRAQVTALLSHNTLEVQFIDYGNRARLSTKDIRHMKLEYVRHSAMAVRCRLQGVPDEEDISTRFRQLATSARMLMTVHNADYQELSLLVTLDKITPSGPFNVNKILTARSNPPAAFYDSPDEKFAVGSSDEEHDKEAIDLIKRDESDWVTGGCGAIYDVPVMSKTQGFFPLTLMEPRRAGFKDPEEGHRGMQAANHHRRRLYSNGKRPQQSGSDSDSE